MLYDHPSSGTRENAGSHDLGFVDECKNALLETVGFVYLREKSFPTSHQCLSCVGSGCTSTKRLGVICECDEFCE